MQEIVGWLKMLGMSEYAHRFNENAIDFQRPPRIELKTFCCESRGLPEAFSLASLS